MHFLPKRQKYAKTYAICNCIDLLALVITIEGLMNARPLAFIEVGGVERAITPGDVLGLNGLMRFSDISFKNARSLAGRWIKINKILDEWWRIFWKVYVPTLHRRNGRLNSTRELQVGDIVVLKEHKNERGQWPIGKVTKILPRKKNSDATTVEIFVNGKTLVRATRGLSFLTKNN